MLTHEHLGGLDQAAVMLIAAAGIAAPVTRKLLIMQMDYGWGQSDEVSRMKCEEALEEQKEARGRRSIFRGFPL